MPQTAARLHAEQREPDPIPMLPHQAEGLVRDLYLPDAAAPDNLVVSYVRLLDAGEHLGAMLRLEVARHAYNLDLFDDDDDGAYVRAIATARPPILDGFARMNPEGIGAMLSSGAPGSIAPAKQADNVVVPFASPPPPAVGASAPVERTLLVVARQADAPDLLCALQVMRIAIDGLAGLVASRLAPHASYVVADAGTAAAAETAGAAVNAGMDPKVAAQALAHAGLLSLQSVIELICRGHPDLADAASVSLRRTSMDPPVDPESLAWCREAILDVKDWPKRPLTPDAHLEAHQDTVRIVQHALLRDEPEDNDLYTAVLAASRTQPLPAELAAAGQGGSGVVVDDRF